MKAGFFEKLIERLDKLDPQSLQTHFLRLAKERGLLETIFQSIQEGVLVVGGMGELTYANKAAEHLLGFSYETAKGRHVSKYLREIDWERVLDLDETEWSKLIAQEIEITYPEQRFLNFYIVPLSSHESTEKGAVVMLRDVTYIRKNEADLLESERLNAVKLLAAGVAHEIGNPLNALNIHLQLLSRDIKSLENGAGAMNVEDQKPAFDNLAELVGVARDEVARLDIIITQFLRAIRPAKPNLVLSKVDDILKDTLNLLKQEIQDRVIDVKIDICDFVPRVKVDRDQIKQAFFNIVKNAFQAMPDGGNLMISITVSDEFLRIAFKDTGVGIDPEDFGQIFEPYNTTKDNGSGLGLMIVQRIVQDHGGMLEVSSKREHGTEFTLSLPLSHRRTRLLSAPKACDMVTS